MGYNLYITRAELWSLNEGHEITAEEWLALVQGDPELQLTAKPGSYFASWKGKSKYSDAWFDWRRGNIYTKNPDKAIGQKMLDLAHKLNARVLGEEGEVYENVADIPD